MKSLKERFWQKVDKKGEDECWEWTASLRRGYGRIEYNYKYLPAHKVSWEIHNGPISDNMLVLHRCDNRKCVNPNHLYLGTYSDNVCDREYRNPGTAGRISRLGATGIMSIRKMYKTGKYTQENLARLFKVSQSHITNIVNRKYGDHTIERTT